MGARKALALLLALLLAGCAERSPGGSSLLPPAPSALCSPTPSPAALSALSLSPKGLADFSPPHAPGVLLVLPGSLRAQALEAEAVLPGGFLKVRVPEGQEELEAKKLLSAGAGYVQPDYLYRPLLVPNDPYYARPPQGMPLGTAYRAIGVEAAWDMLTPLPCAPVVAVLDTAFNPNHPDLAANLLPGRNFTPDGLAQDDLSPSPPRRPDQDHGQAVAGLIGGVAGNGIGIAGVGLNQVKVLPLKVFYWVEGQYVATTSTVAQALRYAADQGALVASLSLGGRASDAVLQEAVGYALSKGTLVVAAAGNEGGDGLYYPARYPGVLAVGAARPDGTRAGYSNYSSARTDLVLAVGGDDQSGPLPSLTFGGYGYWAGTSFATPQVSAAVALYAAKHIGRRGAAPTPDRMRACLTMTAAGSGSYQAETGYGLVRLDRALQDETYCFP